jgi:hypothetical protein
MYMQLRLSPRFISRSSSTVADFDNAHLSGEVQRIALTSEQTLLVEQFLTKLWHSRQVSPPESSALRFFGFGVGGDSRNHIPSGSLVTTDPCYLYCLPMATVYPIHSTIGISDGSYIVEKYGSDAQEFGDFVKNYAEFFGFDTNSGDLNLDDQNPRFKPYFYPTKFFSNRDFTPIFLSNHIHDKTFTHWFSVAVYLLFLLKDFVAEFKNPLFVISYDLEKWQKDILSLFFPSYNIRLLQIDSPTLFEKLFFVHGRCSPFLDGSFLDYLYRFPKNCYPFKDLKLFITRDDAVSRRILNQKELNSLLLKFGYTSLRMGDFSNRDQISLVANATRIIFVEGSTGINLIHARSDVLVGMITYPPFSEWEYVLTNFGIFNVFKFQSEIANRHAAGFDLHIDLSRFLRFMEFEMRESS